MTSFTGMTTEMVEGMDEDKDGKVYVNESLMQMVNAFISESTSNNLDNFKKYIEDNQAEFDEVCNDVQYKYSTDLNIYRADTENGLIKVNPSTMLENMPMMPGMEGMGDMASQMTSMMPVNAWIELIGDDNLMDAQYDVIAGKMPEKFNEVVLIVDGNNMINELVVYALGLKDQEEFTRDIMNALASGESLENEDITEYSYDEILDMKFKLVLSADYFVKDKKYILSRIIHALNF